jgi:hypothetical protein
MPLQPIIGVDFSSAPTKRKPVVLAQGALHNNVLHISIIERFSTLPAFAAWLAQPREWIGGFDLPFGLPRELVQTLGWPLDYVACMAHYAALPRATIRATFKAFCNARPEGGKFAHRACDRPAGSSPSMKWVNPPVAYMLHAGVPLLLEAGCNLPGLRAGDASRVALEAYPGYVARQVLGAQSYKSDDPAKATADRAQARQTLLDVLAEDALEMGIFMQLSEPIFEAARDDASGDTLDACLCALQAAWGVQRRDANYGLPHTIDPLEGWIVGVPAP